MITLLDELASTLRQAGIADCEAEARRIAEAASRSSGDHAEHARTLAQRRIAGAPLAYLIGRETFMGLELIADEGALVPRAETELLGRTVLDILRATPTPAPYVVDMCCGSGNLACAVAHDLPAARVWASDLTDGCVTLARRNVAHIGVGDRVTVVQGDLFAPLAGLGLEGRIDAIVCNPPYISQGKLATDRAELLRHEPREAFDGGPYGLSIHQRVIRDGLAFLRPGGSLAFEIGLGQDRQVKTLIERTKAYDDIQSRTNAVGEVRVVTARKKA